MEFFIIFSFIYALGHPLYATVYGFRQVDLWILWVIAAAVYVVICVFKGIGLYTMAKKQNKTKIGWLGFVPFASTFVMGELSGNFHLGSVKIKHVGLYAMLAEFVLCAFYLMQYVPQSYVFTNGLYTIQTITQNGQTGMTLYYSTDVPQAIVNLINVSTVLANVFYFIQLVLYIFLCMAFFRVYAPASYIWMVVLCAILPVVTAFLVFAFRNRTPIDYDQYMQARMEQIRRAQQAQYGPYGPYGGNPYGQNPYGQNPYSQNPYGQGPYNGPYGQNPNPYGGQGAPKEPDDPFGEYSSPSSGQQGQSGQSGQAGPSAPSSGDDPFGEYSGGSDGNKNS